MIDPPKVLFAIVLLFIGICTQNANVHAQTKQTASKSVSLYFPTTDTWQTISPEQVNWDAEALTSALDFAMQRRSTSVVVLYRGRIIGQRHQTLQPDSVRHRAMVHGKTSQGHVIEDVASVQKSVVSLLVGIAVDKGLVQLDDSVAEHLGGGWSKATAKQEADITLRHLLTMTSGLSTRLRYIAPPGTQWQYNTNAYARALRVVEAASNLSASELTQRWLTGPIGMSDSAWIERPWMENQNIDANQLGFATSAHDLARIGLLVLANGTWDQTEIVTNKAYLRASVSPSQKLNPSYGYLWWLGGQSHAIRAGKRVAGSLIPNAPDDLIAAQGALGRKCYIVPSRQLVVTRLGDNPNERGDVAFDNEFWRRLMLAMPETLRIEPSTGTQQ
ncbi:MAG: serine hydrolase [Pirellulaceae bacterium]|nr:serine hydrolase [Pirellulaceae bacterium]